LTACGAAGVRRSDESNGGPRITSPEDVADYRLEDPACQAQNTGIDVDSMVTWLWDGVNTAPVHEPADAIVSHDRLGSRAILATWYGHSQEETCKMTPGGIRCAGKPTVLTPGRKLKLCRKDGEYARASIEAVALSAIFTIDKAWSFYHRMAGAHTDMERTNLLIFPEIRQKITGGSEKTNVISSNLAYARSYRRAPTLVIYPGVASENPGDNPKRPNLWESPWSLAHEFGHHVLKTHTGIASIGSSVAASDAGDLPHLNLSETLPDGSTRDVGAATVWEAVNEGFADLFAFYEQGQATGLLNAIPCMGASRDLASNKFSNGRLKVLDDSALSEFQAEVYLPIRDCATPNFQEPHSMGAAIAYGVYQVFAKSLVVQDEGSAKGGDLLILWADALQSLVATASDEVSIQSTVKAAITVAAHADKALTPDQCSAIRDIFPVWSKDWLEGEAPAFICEK
jgi:hypothetical protein